MDNLEREALESLRSEEREADRERAFQKKEEQFEDLSIMDKIDVIVGETQALKAMLDDLAAYTSQYATKEGEDIRDLYAKAEALRDAEQERNLDHAQDSSI